jgi:hypothetical protein
LSASRFRCVAAELLLQEQLLSRISSSTLAPFLAATQQIRHGGDASHGINSLRFSKDICAMFTPKHTMNMCGV